MNPARARPLPAAFLLAAALAGCVADPYRDPLPGHEASVRLAPAGETAETRWPLAYRRGAVFLVSNPGPGPVETVLVEILGARELVEAEVLDRPGAGTAILRAPQGSWSRAALVGTPGTRLLEPGESLRLRLYVLGDPGRMGVRFEVPGDVRN